jgi:phosphatidylglycerophosphate synthase
VSGSGPIIAWWISVPLAGLLMAVIVAHVMSLQRPEVPASRRRIRSAAGVLMLLLTPLLAFALSHPIASRPRSMAIAWLGVVVLLAVIVGLAWLDAFNNLRLYRKAKRLLLEEALQRPGGGAERDAGG